MTLGIIPSLKNGRIPNQLLLAEGAEEEGEDVLSFGVSVGRIPDWRGVEVGLVDGVVVVIAVRYRDFCIEDFTYETFSKHSFTL